MPVVDHVVARGKLAVGQHVLDLGTGTGAVAARACEIVGSEGRVVAVDISADMLARAQQRFSRCGIRNVVLCEGRAENLPVAPEAFDVVLASLRLMYVIDRKAAARELARVLRPGGRLVAAVWSAPEQCDIVRFQQIAGPPPVPGVGPGSLADPKPFLAELAEAGISAKAEVETLGFEFEDFASAWDALAGVTTAGLSSERRQEAMRAVREAMYVEGDGPRHFSNATHFIVGQRTG